MKIEVYQINAEKDKDRLLFLDFSHQPDPIDSSIYDLVYIGEHDLSSLEDAYTMLNINQPEDYRGRSLSVSDVVHVDGSQGPEEGYYFCDSIGFKKINFKIGKEIKND